MNAQAEYESLVKELEAIERRLDAEGVETKYGAYLTDTNIDRENVLVDGMTEDHPDFWGRMIDAAKSAAGYRAEEMGLNINKLIGRTIY